MQRLRAWLERVPIDDPVDRDQAVTVEIFCFLAMVWLAVAIVVSAARGTVLDHPFPNAIAPLGVMIALVGEVALIRSGRYRFALYVGLAGLLAPAAVLVAQGFAQAPFRLLYLVILLAVAAMLRGRGALWTVFTVSFAAVAVGAARDAGYLGGPASPPAPPLGTFGNAAVPLVILTVLLHRFAEPMREAMGKARRRAHELEASEERFRHVQKLEAMGRLAGGVAHDFNNILTSVLASAELLREALPPDHPGRAEVQQIDSDARRAAELTQQLLSFARKQETAPQVIRIEGRARSLERMLRRVMGANIAVETAFPAQGWPVFVDPGQVEQVILNLAVNARDAMPSGGRLTISAENVTIHDAPARQGDPPPGEYVLLSVVDTGTGMTSEVMAHLFEPFFTTKGSQGTGLGLATCFGIVSQAGGTIAVESAPGAGTRFRIYLPRAAAAVGAPGAGQVLDLHGSETILVVEDDSAVRRLAVRSLAQLGYEVIDAGSAAEAQEKLSRHPRAIQGLLMDVQLPDGEGPEAARRILSGRGSVPVLFVSGAPEALGEDAASDQFLAKPYAPIDLARRLRVLMDRGRSADGS